ncbi:respiratory nitrate reductase subunit gamma [Maribellus sp. CM-23]|uniref:respiratory nitrate reductase subunit gamma n=1 Tax=Maribellus sp. CM-23 TaxID=2781026 RepID=UPI001F35B011|nr:respiratory nitrate reductase subunit gamma [Maribellus sp. CM-23]MCE4566948.1 respiratory nitrate reductase subunit gamma [Maribellus sp. CM-23]
MNATLFFVILPYLALLSFLMGTIYRYWFMPFLVSSLSSQFLESKKLYFGSRPFHWGIIFLFFGHLTAFLIPSTVLAWNQIPLRLYILEVSALTFALLFLTGLILLVIRRVESKRIRQVTSYMDVFVYVILMFQAITGIWTATFFRWGASWFSIVLAPYLKSVFMFNPDANAVSQLPLVVQLHIVGAFVLIGMVPFTRFIHFLVYPLSYLWRPYQKVVWNYRNTEF